MFVVHEFFDYQIWLDSFTYHYDILKQFRYILTELSLWHKKRIFEYFYIKIARNKFHIWTQLTLSSWNFSHTMQVLFLFIYLIITLCSCNYISWLYSFFNFYIFVLGFYFQFIFQVIFRYTLFALHILLESIQRAWTKMVLSLVNMADIVSRNQIRRHLPL